MEEHKDLQNREEAAGRRRPVAVGEAEEGGRRLEAAEGAHSQYMEVVEGQRAERHF